MTEGGVADITELSCNCSKFGWQALNGGHSLVYNFKTSSHVSFKCVRYVSVGIIFT